MGPVEFLIVEFPGNKFSGEIVPELIALVESETIRIIDLLFIKKDADGNVTSFELPDLDASEAAPFDALDGDVGNLVSEDDIAQAAEMLQPESSAALLVFENAWAERFAVAVRNANGRVVANARIPLAQIDAALAARSE